MILLIKSETANLGAWINILKKLELKFVLSDQKNWDVGSINGIIFPGIGNFNKVAENIKRFNLDKKILFLVKKNIPYLGICVGMQILFKESEESEKSNYHKPLKGLNLIKGKVLKISEKNIVCPHNGWNNIQIKKNLLFQDIKDNSDFYFNHSYYCYCENKKIITSTLKDNQNIVSSINQKNIFAIQFHPEKSMGVGLKLIENFVKKIC